MLSRPVARMVGAAGFRFKVEGRSHVPEGPVVLAANHVSHVDPPFVGLALGHPIRFMAAADLIGINRGLDFFLPFYGAILLPRSHVPLGAMKKALSHLADGGVVGVFPEGRRAAHWGEGEPKRGAAWLALRASVPLVPVAVIGTDNVMSLEARKVTFAPVTVRFGMPIAPEGTPATLTDRWVGEVSELLGDAPPEPDPPRTSTPT
ncbi:MAG: 1-acyl-sn-glycerol-3-phosphate acyltransferase [Acidimicrobiia bacterium]|nr:1-acyl-sn-glycerol-3-phosphate acyltransferase [Acidimicrobiia bacterium]